MANSGGVVVVGVDGQGGSRAGTCAGSFDTDPADLANKLASFTGRDFDGLAVRVPQQRRKARRDGRGAGCADPAPMRGSREAGYGVLRWRRVRPPRSQERAGDLARPGTDHQAPTARGTLLLATGCAPGLRGSARLSVTVSPRPVQVVPDTVAAAPCGWPRTRARPWFPRGPGQDAPAPAQEPALSQTDPPEVEADAVGTSP